VNERWWAVVLVLALPAGGAGCKEAGPECRAAGDCAGRSFPLPCTGHWACDDGSCRGVCDRVTCAVPADCEILPPAEDCRSRWECVGGDCVASCAGYACAEAADCAARPWTSACLGHWDCAANECTAACDGTPCAVSDDCAALPWTRSCPGAWVCRNGQCIADCAADGCETVDDCRRLDWTVPCGGYWECTDGRCAPRCSPFACDEQIPFHEPVLDAGGRLLPWDTADGIVRRALGFVERCPTDRLTGLPWYMQYCDFRYQTMEPDPWPHNPAGLYAMMVETLVRWWPYSGDRSWIARVRRPLDQLIAESTPADDAWPRVPYASADNSGHYRGGSTEGTDGIESDKIGQAAVGYLRFFQTTGERRYLYEALHCAQVLAEKIRPGDDAHSPWPFRVNARTGEVLEEYTSDVLWPIVLFDELERLGLAADNERAARAAAWDWLLHGPLRTGVWKGYFEDVPFDAANTNLEQYTPGEVARYLLRRPELDPDWRTHVPALLDWIKETLGDTDPKWLGATGIREQLIWRQLAGSHTARYASVRAMLYEATGDEAYREEALRSLALAGYLERDDGVVPFSLCDDSVWFTDGYFDYVPHFLDAMAALPELAPAGEDHLLRSSSVVTDVAYAPGRVEYTTFHDEGVELLRLAFVPARVLADGRPLPTGDGSSGDSSFAFDPARNVLQVRRRGATHVVVAAE